MKRLSLIALLTGLMLLLLCGTALACPNPNTVCWSTSFKYNAESPTQTQHYLICFVCGYNFWENHWTSGNEKCTEQATCGTCERLFHTDNHETTTQSTCKTQAACTGCGDLLPLDPDNHESTTYPTCTEGVVCTGCEKDWLALGHSFTNYVSNGNATCAADGTKTAICDHDGCMVTDTVADQGSALVHWFGAWTPSGEGKHGATCRRDGCREQAACDCVPSTLSLNGAEITFCPVCGATDGEPLPPVAVAAEAINALPQGEFVAWLGTSADGAAFLAVAYEQGGVPVERSGEARVSVPGDVLSGLTPDDIAFEAQGGQITLILDFSTTETPVFLVALKPAA